MISATIIMMDGSSRHESACTWQELFDKLRGLRVKKITAADVNPSEYRQGKH